MPTSKSRSIFISHAVADKEIADRVTDLLALGLGIDAAKEIFCCSLEGLGIPPGKDFKQFIKDQIQEPKVVFLLISQNYLASAFCLAEVGACWAMSHAIVPILISPMKFSDMKAVLTGAQAGQIDDAAYWNEVFDVLKRALKINPPTNRWERKRNEKIAEIQKLLPKQPPVPLVARAKLEEAETRLKEANQDLDVSEGEIARLKVLIEKLKKAKDADETAAIELEALPESEAFDELIKKANKRLNALPKVVGKALYHQFRGEKLRWPTFGGDDLIDEIRAALQANLLEDFEGRGVGPNGDEPKVARAEASLDELKWFIDKNPTFAELYEEKYDHQLVFTSDQFWKEHLN